MISCDIFYAVTDTCQKIKTLLVGASCSTHQKKVDEKRLFNCTTTLFYREPLLTANNGIKSFRKEYIFSNKVEKILKGNPDLILSPSSLVKIQITGRKVCLRHKAKHCWALSTNFFFQKFVDNTNQCFAFTPQANFPAHNLNFQ